MLAPDMTAAFDSSRGGGLRVFVLASVRLYREGLADALRRAGMDVVGVAGTWAQAHVALRARPPNVAVLDVAGPRGLEIVGELRRRIPETRIVVLAVDEVERDVLAWAEAGACGYVTRDGSVDDLVRTVRSAARREAHCAPKISGALLEHVHVLATGGPPPAPIGSLTAREHEIAELLAAELSNKQIAAELQIELATVKNHVHSILAKLEVSRRADAGAEMRRARGRLVSAR
jgi:two-component system, NarL family, nitrate/nitrite response regulator NarL